MPLLDRVYEIQPPILYGFCQEPNWKNILNGSNCDWQLEQCFGVASLAIGSALEYFI
jgi:hypothetical protein